MKLKVGHPDMDVDLRRLEIVREAAGADATVMVDCNQQWSVPRALEFGVPVVPHVGDIGQIHQHLVIFNHMALGHEALLLEHIPHLKDRFVHPCRVEAGVYQTPHEPGMGSDLL